MAKTLAQILEDVNAVLDLEASQPTGDELDARTNYANQVIWDVSALGQLQEFRREFIALATGATVSLPVSFKEFQEDPMLLDSTGNWRRYVVIEPQEKYNQDSQSNYGYVIGNPQDGYNLILSRLSQNMTISIIYQKFPDGFATDNDGADYCELSDPQVVARGIESYVLYSRSDDRFPQANAKYERSLANMMGRGMKGAGGLNRDTKMKFKNPLG